jgi:UPF0716 protein FxsA
LFALVLLVIVAAELFAFIEVGHAIGWLLAVVVLLGTSVLGSQLLRIQARAAVARVSLAVSERRAPGAAAIDGALGLLGAVMLAVPGFVTDAVGIILLFPLTRALTRRWLSHRYANRVISFASATGRFAPGRGRRPPADVDSTVVEDDLGQLPR